MALQYSNLPIPQQVLSKSSSDDTLKFFDAYNKTELQFKASEADATVAFFMKRGMDENAAKSTAVIFLKQCKVDGVSALSLLDQLKNISNEVQLTDTIGEILNINRIKTSSLGQKVSPGELDNPAKRNIIA